MGQCFDCGAETTIVSEKLNVAGLKAVSVPLSGVDRSRGRHGRGRRRQCDRELLVLDREAAGEVVMTGTLRIGLVEDNPGDVRLTQEALKEGKIKNNYCSYRVTVIGWVEDPDHYPIQPKAHSVEYLREVAHLRPRTNIIGATARVRQTLAQAIHGFAAKRPPKSLFSRHRCPPDIRVLSGPYSTLSVRVVDPLARDKRRVDDPPIRLDATPQE